MSATASRIGALLAFRARRLAGWEGWYRGRGFGCPCCGGEFRRLRDFRGRGNAQCPRCGSVERQRVLMLYLQRETGLFADEEADLLEFAPESALSEALSSRPNIRYESADLEPGRAMHVMDITRIPRADAAYDYVLASHVLEHIPDDRAAMAELLRVLRPGGVALLQQPVDHGRELTYEDWGLTTAEERLEAFGQEDHVRVYGSDLAQRLSAAGFDVTVRRYRSELGESERLFYRLDEGTETIRADDVYECVRPDRSA